jgi:hypothetical protein
MGDVTEERILKLERTIQSTRRMSFGCAAVIAALGFALIERERRAANIPEELRVRSLVVVDDSGGVAARLGTTTEGGAPTGGGTLFLRAEHANAKVVIGAMNDDAGLGIVVGDHARIDLAVGREGFPSLGFTDAAGKSRLLAGLDRKDSAAVLLRSASGKPRLILNSDESAAIVAMDASGTTILSLPDVPSSQSHRDEQSVVPR